MIKKLVFILVLFCCITSHASANENLIEDINGGSNITVTDGIIHQVNADIGGGVQWKVQIFFSNDRHYPLEGIDGWSLVQPMTYNNNQTGLMSHTFTTPEDLEDFQYFRFGLNGATIDTIVLLQIKDLMPSTTYTIQWRVLNATQGEIAWTDMFLTRCGDGYSLALGNETCSRECENQSVTGGHIPPDSARVYEPAVCTYDQSQLVCDDGYNKINNSCEQMCTAGITRLHIGEKVNGLYSRKLGTPALCIKYNDQTCYGHLTPGHGAGLNINIDGVVYHLID